MYHRVFDAAHDPWNMCVSAGNFEHHLSHVKNNFPILRLSDLPSLLQRRRLPRRAIVVTFDDGYVDNFTTALPLLEATGVPATFFIQTGAIGTGVEFWWDELERLVLAAPDDVGRVRLPVLPSNETQDWPTHTPAERLNSYYSLYRLLQPLTSRERERIMGALRTWAHHDQGARPEFRPMERTELCQLGASPCADIGSHTHFHPLLPTLTAEEQQSEIACSAATLRRWLGRPVAALAYPFGRYNRDSVRAAASTGLAVGVTSDRKAVQYGDDVLCLGRFFVQNWDAWAFAAKLREFFWKQDARHG